jgi:hypothetical protein
MSVSDTLTQEWTEKSQMEDVFTARAQYEGATNQLEDAYQQVEAIIDAGSFDTVPNDVKTAMLEWRTIIQTFRTSVNANADIMAILNWRP